MREALSTNDCLTVTRSSAGAGYAHMHKLLVSLPPDPPPSCPAAILELKLASFLSKQWGPPQIVGTFFGFCGRSGLSNEPLNIALATITPPASAILPCFESSITRFLFVSDHLLTDFLGVNFRAYLFSSNRFIRLSIQPKHKASSRDCS